MKVTTDDTNVDEHTSADPVDITIEVAPPSNVNENTIDDIPIIIVVRVREQNIPYRYIEVYLNNNCLS